MKLYNQNPFSETIKFSEIMKYKMNFEFFKENTLRLIDHDTENIEEYMQEWYVFFKEADIKGDEKGAVEYWASNHFLETTLDEHGFQLKESKIDRDKMKSDAHKTIQGILEYINPEDRKYVARRIARLAVICQGIAYANLLCGENMYEPVIDNQSKQR